MSEKSPQTIIDVEINKLTEELLRFNEFARKARNEAKKARRTDNEGLSIEKDNLALSYDRDVAGIRLKIAYLKSEEAKVESSVTETEADEPQQAEEPSPTNEDEDEIQEYDRIIKEKDLGPNDLAHQVLERKKKRVATQKKAVEETPEANPVDPEVEVIEADQIIPLPAVTTFLKDRRKKGVGGINVLPRGIDTIIPGPEERVNVDPISNIQAVQEEAVVLPPELPPLPPPTAVAKEKKTKKTTAKNDYFDPYENIAPQTNSPKNEYYNPYDNAYESKVGKHWEKRGETAEEIHKASAILRKNGVGENLLKPIEKREDEKMWIQEKTEAEITLTDARAKFVKEHQAGAEAHKNRPFKKKFMDAVKFWKKKEIEPTDKFKSARKEYDTAKKRFQNAESNLIRGKEDGKTEKEIQAQIAKELLLNVSAREYSELAKARAETLTPTDKGRTRKVFDYYRGMSKGKKLLVTSAFLAGVTFTGFGPAAAAGVFAGRFAQGLIGFGAGGLVTAGTKSFLNRRNNKERESELTKAGETYSPIADINAFDTIENKAELKRFKAALIAAGAGAAAAFITTLEVRASGVIDSVTSQTTDYFIPDRKLHGDVMPTPVLKSTINTEVKNGPSEIVTDKIKDYKVHGKIVHDSAEMSLRKTLESNAEKFGWKSESGMTANKWAEIETDKYVDTTEGLDIRHAVTHDGNLVVVEANPDGGFHARVENGSGKMYTMDNKYEKLFAEKKTFGPDVPAHKSIAWNELNKIPKAKLLDAKVSVPEIIREYALRGKVTPTQVKAFRELMLNKKIV